MPRARESTTPYPWGSNARRGGCLLLRVSGGPRSVGETPRPSDHFRRGGKCVWPLRHTRQCPAVGTGLFRELVLGVAARRVCVRGTSPFADDRTVCVHERNEFVLVSDAARRRLGQSCGDDSIGVPELWSWPWSDASGLSERRCGLPSGEIHRVVVSADRVREKDRGFLDLHPETSGQNAPAAEVRPEAL
jgi:hypothetical protein